MNKALKITLWVLASIAVLFFILFIIVWFTPLEPEVIIDETLVVDESTWDYYWFDVYEMDIVDITIEANEAINILIMNEEQFNAFSDETIGYFASEGGSAKVKAATYSFQIQEDDTYYLVIDNGNLKGSATSIGTVDAKVKVVIT